MGFLRFIWKDVMSLRPAMKFAGLVFGVAFIVGAWFLGAEWWTTPVNFVVKGMARKSPPLEIMAVVVATILIVYIAYAADRYRNPR